MIFILAKFTFFLIGNKNLSQSNFKICYDYIKNNSDANLGDKNHIRIV